MTDELVGPSELRGTHHRLEGCVGDAEGEVVSNSRRKKECILEDGRDRRAEFGEAETADIDPIEDDAPGPRIVKAREEPGNGGLPRTGRPEGRDGLPRRDGQVEVRQHLPSGAVVERDVLEADLAS